MSEALRSDFGGRRSAIKHIAQITGAHPDTVSNWYQGKNIPNFEYLILLARSSPSLARAIIELTGETKTESNYFPLKGRPRKPSLSLERQHGTKTTGSDVTKNVTINVNSRQNWFVEQLSQGREVRPIHIVEHWCVSLRTAKRDIRDLKSKGLVTYHGHPRRGQYLRE